VPHVQKNILFEMVGWCGMWVSSFRGGLRAGCEGISTVAQYVTTYRKKYYQKVKMCRFISGNWFFCNKFVQLT
jgi:hypothetical protein